MVVVSFTEHANHLTRQYEAQSSGGEFTRFRIDASIRSGDSWERKEPLVLAAIAAGNGVDIDQLELIQKSAI